MKTLLVKPGIEFVEKTLRGPWPPELNHLEKLYSQSWLVFRATIPVQIFVPSSVLAVGSVLKKLGEDVEYLDIPLEFGVPLKEEQKRKRHEKIAQYIAQGGYDVVGISCTSSLESITTQRVAEAAKEISEDITVIVGGYQAASEARDLMEKVPAIDVIVLSDFEPIAEQLYSSFNGKIPMNTIPNIICREKGRIRASEGKYIEVRPEDLPIYDYSLIKKYIPKYAVFIFETSRGCPYDCSFCQEKVLRRSYTVKDAASAVDEIIDAANYIAQFTESLYFFYSDPLWGLNQTWVKDFCLQLAERRDEITSSVFKWMILARIGQFNHELLTLMKKAGCSRIGFGVESLSPKMLRMMNKTRDPQKYIASVFDTVKNTLRADMDVMLFNILGMPGETPSTIKEALNSIKKLPLENKNLHIHFSLAFPFKGTLLDEQIHDPQFVEKHGVRILDECDWEKSYIPLFTLLFDPSKKLSASELVDIYLDLARGTLGIPSSYDFFRKIQSHKKQVWMLKFFEMMLDRDEIPPKELVRFG